MALSAKPYLQSVSIRPGVEIDFDAYPHNIPAVRDIEQLSFHADVTFFVGENGAGKSTVLEAIAVALGHSPEGGTRNVRLATTQSVSPLHEVLRLRRSFRQPRGSYFLRAESLFNVATYMDQIGDPSMASLHARSHGEAFLALFTEKFGPDGLYLLDEPEAALSPNRQLAALVAMHRLVLDGAQFIIATHSPILLAYPNAKIVLFDGAGLTEVRYEDTEHDAVTRDFLNHHPRRLEQLLADEPDGE